MTMPIWTTTAIVRMRPTVARAVHGDRVLSRKSWMAPKAYRVTATRSRTRKPVDARHTEQRRGITCAGRLAWPLLVLDELPDKEGLSSSGSREVRVPAPRLGFPLLDRLDSTATNALAVGPSGVVSELSPAVPSDPTADGT